MTTEEKIEMADREKADRESRERCAQIAADGAVACSKEAGDAARDVARIHEGSLK